MKRECRTCKEVKPLEEFNKGNAKYGRKSECKICQGKRSREYKKRPEVKIKDREWQRNKYQKMNLEERTSYYLKNRDKVDKWNIDHPEKYTASRKVRSSRRQARLADAGPLDLSSVLRLQDYNTDTFGQGKVSYTCEYCLAEIRGPYHLEHIVPVSKGGENSLNNLAISCETCNLQKGAKLIEDWDPEAWDYLQNRKL